MDKLLDILKDGYWIQVMPNARLNPDEWLVAIYKRKKKEWTTEHCKDKFDSPMGAYEWAFNKIKE